MFIINSYKSLKPVVRKFIFFYVLLHVIAISTYSFSFHPSFKTTPSSEQQSATDQEKWNTAQSTAHAYRDSISSSKWNDRINFIQKFADTKTDIPRSRDAYLFRYYGQKAIDQARITQGLTSRDFVLITDLTLLLNNPNYDVGIGETVYLPTKAAIVTPKRVNEIYVFGSGEYNSSYFWPFSKYSDETYMVGQSYRKRFLGVFSGYDWSEFSLYIILPLITLLLYRFYKMYVN